MFSMKQYFIWYHSIVNVYDLNYLKPLATMYSFKIDFFIGLTPRLYKKVWLRSASLIWDYKAVSQF